MKDMYRPTRRDARALENDVRKGTKLYTVSEHAQNLAPYEDQFTYDEHTVSYQHPLTGDWMICGSLSVKGLLHRYGAVYTSPPAGVRNSRSSAPQVAGPRSDRIADDVAKARGGVWMDRR